MADPNNPKFTVGEKIRPSMAARIDYEVLKTPATYVHNNEPCYQLRAMGPIETNPFHREQADLEATWVSADKCGFLFPMGRRIRHKKSGGEYRVVITPNIGRLEATNTPAYSYVEDKPNGLVWHRCQTEMEDGRFELIPVEPIKQFAPDIHRMLSLRDMSGQG